MKKSLSLFIVFAACSLSCWAQSYSDLKEQAEEAFNAYELDKAVELGEAAYELVDAVKMDQPNDYAEVKNDLGVYYAFNFQTEKGIQFIKESNAIIKRLYGEESKEYIEKVNNLTSVCYMLGQTENALESANESVTLSKALYGNQHGEYAYALNSRGMVLVVLGKHEQAEIDFKQAVVLFESNKRSLEYASALTNLGDLYIEQSKYNAAIENLTAAVDYFKNNNETNSKSYADCLFTLGKVYKLKGNYEESLKAYLASGEVSKSISGENHQDYATTLSAIAGLYEEIGKYTEAEEMFKSAIAIKKATIGDKDLSYFITSNNLAKLYLSLGRNNEAREILEPVVINSSPDAANFPLDFVSFGSNLALSYQRLGLLSDAETLYENILLIQEAVLGKEDYSNVSLLNNIATLKIEQSKFGEADVLFERCIAILKATKMTFTKDYVDINYMKAINKMNQEKYEDAKGPLVRAIELAPDVYGVNHKMTATIHINMGYLLHKSGAHQPAPTYYKKGLDIYKHIIAERFAFMSNAEKEQFKNDLHLHFSFFKQLVINHPNPQLWGDLYNYHLMLKSMMMDAKLQVRKSISTSKDAGVQQLFNDWVTSRELLNKLYSFSSQDLLTSQVNIDSIADYSRSLENKLALQSNTLDELKTYTQITWQDIQEQLSDNEAAIEIIRTAFYGEDDPIDIKYVALIISSKTKSGPTAVVLEEGRKMENEWSDEFYYKLFQKENDNASYNRFWSPIAAKTKGIEKLYVSRTGIYHVMNLSTFKLPEKDSYVLDENEIVLLGNTRELIAMKKEGEKPFVFNDKKKASLIGYPSYYLNIIDQESEKNELLALANASDRSFKTDIELLDDLPGTKTEVEQIEQTLTAKGLKTQVYIGDDATEVAVKQISNPSILHIATHGFFDWQYEDQADVSHVDRSVSSRDPLYRSGLMLAGSGFIVKLVEGKMSLINELEDGVLSAYEVVNMDLSQTDLVVLSACLSGIGSTKVKDTESFSGLTEAFILAGSKSVVTSGWSVDDAATQELMNLFYTNLAAKMTKREALRQAQISLKAKYPQPYYWGPFSMVGW